MKAAQVRVTIEVIVPLVDFNPYENEPEGWAWCGDPNCGLGGEDYYYSELALNALNALDSTRMMQAVKSFVVEDVG